MTRSQSSGACTSVVPAPAHEHADTSVANERRGSRWSATAAGSDSGDTDLRSEGASSFTPGNAGATIGPATSSPPTLPPAARPSATGSAIRTTRSIASAARPTPGTIIGNDENEEIAAQRLSREVMALCRLSVTTGTESPIHEAGLVIAALRSGRHGFIRLDARLRRRRG